MGGNMDVSNTEVKKERSGFVTGLAWIFIVLGGFATFIGLMQNIMLFYLFPAEEINQVLAEQGPIEQMPTVFRFMFSHIELIFMSFFAFFMLILVSAIGLLKRKNWARVMFITLMVLAIIWNVLGAGVQLFMFDSLPMPADEQLPVEFEKVQHIMQGFMLGFLLAIIGLFVWIIRKLTSDTIKTEFI